MPHRRVNLGDAKMTTTHRPFAGLQGAKEALAYRELHPRQRFDSANMTPFCAVVSARVILLDIYLTCKHRLVLYFEYIWNATAMTL